jgi:alpha/beta superfamily hydrolase
MTEEPRPSSRHVSFEGASGERLAARLDLPDGEPGAWALFAHCFTCGKDLKSVGRISRALAARGIAVMRFDFTGIGESEGDFADTTVDIAQGERLFAGARQPKSFVSLDGADHLLLDDPSGAAFVGELLATWAGRYLP